MISDIICSSLGIIFSSVVFLFFVFVPFESRYRYNHLKTGLLIFSIMATNAAIALIWLYARLEYPGWSVLAIISGAVYGVVIFLITVKDSWFEGLFILMVLLNIFSDISVLSKLIAGLSRWETSPCIIFFTAEAGILIFYIPLLWILIFKLYRPVIEFRIYHSVLKFIWIVPFLDYVMLHGLIAVDSLVNLAFGILWAISSYLLFFIVFLLLNRKYERTSGKEQIRLITAQLKMQEEQYKQLSKNVEELTRIKHDWRHHLLILSGMAKEQKLEELQQYLTDLMPVYLNEKEISVCENHVVNIILCHYKTIAAKYNIAIKICADLPQDLAISDLDLCVIFGNLIENSIEACRSQRGEYKFISIKAAMKEKSLVVMIKNTYGKKVIVKNNVYYSTSHRGAGRGLPSVRYVVEKYNGYMQLEYDDDYFYVNLMLHITQ